jgi:hypothetical protein
MEGLILCLVSLSAAAGQPEEEEESEGRTQYELVLHVEPSMEGSPVQGPQDAHHSAVLSLVREEPSELQVGACCHVQSCISIGLLPDVHCC